MKLYKEEHIFLPIQNSSCRDLKIFQNLIFIENFIANLAPRKLKGIVSEGMILSAENNDGSLAVIMPQKEVKPGSEVK